MVIPSCSSAARDSLPNAFPLVPPDCRSHLAAPQYTEKLLMHAHTCTETLDFAQHQMAKMKNDHIQKLHRKPSVARGVTDRIRVRVPRWITASLLAPWIPLSSSGSRGGGRGGSALNIDSLSHCLLSRPGCYISPFLIRGRDGV